MCDSEGEQIPIVLCGNKVDVPSQERMVRPKDVKFHRKRSMEYFEISAKSNFNFEKPFVWLAQQISGNPELMFVEPPALKPPVVQIDRAMMSAYEQELQQAKMQPLPDADSDDI